MKILLSWLNEYGDFGDPTNPDDVQRVADALTSLGLEVDSVEVVGETVPGVVTARVLRLEQHPDAAKVQRVWVDTGDAALDAELSGFIRVKTGLALPAATRSLANSSSCSSPSPPRSWSSSWKPPVVPRPWIGGGRKAKTMAP